MGIMYIQGVSEPPALTGPEEKNVKKKRAYVHYQGHVVWTN